MRFFFYGTLIDPDVRRVVLGARTNATLLLRDGVLHGWERRAVRHARYPVILPCAGGSVDGIVASGLDAAACRRLTAYEGPEYVVSRVRVACTDGRTREACAFTPSPDGPLEPSAEPWDYAHWAAHEKREFLRSIEGGFDA